MGKTTKLIMLISCLLISTAPLYSQSVGYSQFYANPLYLNPALAGSKICPRVTLNYRTQWTSLSPGYNSFGISGDAYFESLSGGVGALVNVDNEVSLLNTISGDLMYSYRAQLSDDFTMNLALQAGFAQRKLNWDNLVFADQLLQSLVSGQIGPTQEVPPAKLVVMKPDFAAGFLIGYKYGTYLGFAVHHLTTPNVAFYPGAKAPLERRYTVHAGTIIDFKQGISGGRFDDLSISPNVVYMQEGKFQQLNVGAQLNIYPMVGGVWYRHNFTNPDAVILMVGFTQEKFKIGYSFDATISDLGLKAGGAHELSFCWILDCFEKKHAVKAIKCPTF